MIDATAAAWIVGVFGVLFDLLTWFGLVAGAGVGAFAAAVLLSGAAR